MNYELVELRLGLAQGYILIFVEVCLKNWATTKAATMSNPLCVLGAIRRSIGIVVSIVILTAMSYVTYGFDRWARILVGLVEWAMGVEIESDKIPLNGQRVFNKPVYEAQSDGVIDEVNTRRYAMQRLKFL